MNHPKILEYLFQKTLNKNNNLEEAKNKLENEFYSVKLDNTQKEEIESLFLTMIGMMEKYDLLLLKYKELTKNYIKSTSSKINHEVLKKYQENWMI